MIPNLIFRLRRLLRILSPDILQSRVNQRCIHFTIQAIFIFVTLSFLCAYLYTETYVWQVTSFASVVQPVKRRTCVLPSPSLSSESITKHRKLQFESEKHRTNQSNHLRSHSASFGHKGSHYLPSNSSVEVTHSSDTTNTAKAQISSSPSQNPVKIGILMIYSNSDGNWGNDLMQRVIQNREDYAKRHQYTVVTANELVDKTRPPAWSKLRAMDHYLYQFDYLMYIDMDVVIMHHSTPLSVFMDLSPSSDFIMTEDWNGVNTGIWLAKNTDFAHWFLKTAWNQTQLIPKKSKEGIPYPFEYEQRAFHFLLNTEIWQQRRLPHYRGDIEEIRKHFFLLPQCAFNSYIMHPWYWHGDREKSQYVEGDFLVHFAGKKGQIKTNLMKYFLDESSKKSL